MDFTALQSKERQNDFQEKIAVGLGWFSLGLGLAQVLAPRGVAKVAGLKKNDMLMRIFGLREIASGLGILARRHTGGWLWTRVAGDAMDLVVMGAALTSGSKSRQRRVVAAMAAVAGITALDVYCSQQLSKRNGTAMKKLIVRKSVIIDRSPEDLYEFWHHFDRLAVIMNHIKSVERIGDNCWHWVAKAPAGMSVKWDAEVIEEVPNELIAWRSLDGADVDNAGIVQFEPASGGRGTVVRVELAYSPPGGVIGGKLAKLFGEAPEQQIGVDLRRFKQLMETGEIARTEGQSAGRASSTSKKYDEFVHA